MASMRLSPRDEPVNAVVSLPGSKSITNRALVAAALADGTSVLSGALFADDTRLMIDALRELGFRVTADETDARIEVTGAGGQIPSTGAELFCGNSGTTLRFCAALSALGFGQYTLDGVARMRERPVGPLVDALRSLGAGVEFGGRDGYPPMTIHAQGLRGGTVSFEASPSSQFISAVLLAAPAAGGDVMIELEAPIVSRPYLSMTSAVMESFGVGVIQSVEATATRFIVAAPQMYRATHYLVEPDASNASYFLAAAAVSGGSVTVRGLGGSTIQGDAGIVDILDRMGCAVARGRDGTTVTAPGGGARLTPVDIDLCDMPDMVQTVAVLALFCAGRTVIRNAGNLRLKETDRLAATARELRKLGATVEELSDGLAIDPPRHVAPAAIDTYDDHRMAMSFSLPGLAVEGVVINGAECVSKTFPDFFTRWSAVCRCEQC